MGQPRDRRRSQPRRGVWTTRWMRVDVVAETACGGSSLAFPCRRYAACAFPWENHGKPGQVGTACGGLLFSLPLGEGGPLVVDEGCLSQPQPSPRLRRPSPRRGLTHLAVDEVKSYYHNNLTHTNITCLYRKTTAFLLLHVPSVKE